MPSVMIVDDDVLVRATLASALGLAGFAVVAVENGDEALRRLDEGEPDVVVTDIFMPGKEGFETIREIHERHPALAIVAMTGGGFVGSEPILRMARRFGVVHAMQKPFAPSDLVAWIESYFADRRAARKGV